MIKLKRKCPFCGGDFRIQMCDDEGNFKHEDYAADPWSGLYYLIVHSLRDVPPGQECPISSYDDDRTLGNYMYTTVEEAEEAVTPIGERKKCFTKCQ